MRRLAMRRGFTVFLGMLLLGRAADAQEQATGAPISAQKIQRDARLKTPVSLSADRMYLGELLEKLSAETHVALSVDLKDDLSSVEITCDLKQMPLANVMNSLWSLLGNKNGSWEWTIDGSQAQPRYQLHSTPAARMEPGRLNRLKQETFERLAEQLIRMEALKPEERKLAEKQLPPVMRIDDPDLRIGAADPNRGNFWEGIRLLGTLAPELRRLVLQGQTFDISFDTLPAKDRKAALTMEPSMSGADARKQPGASYTAPDRARFMVQAGAPTNDLTFQILIGSQHRLGGRTYFATRLAGLYPRIVADWIGPGDQAIREIEDEPLPDLVAFPAESLWNKTAPPDHNIAQLAAMKGVSFMAVLPSEPWAGFPIHAAYMPRLLFSEAAQGSVPLMHKWRDGVLLVSYPGWFYGDPGQVSYSTIARLRDRLQAQNGLLSLQDLIEPVAGLSEVQRRRLSAEFPPLRPEFIRDRILAFRNRFPQVEQGIPFDEKAQVALEELGIGAGGVEPDERRVLIRLVDLPDRDAPEPQHHYSLQIMTSNQRTIDLAGFRIKPIDPNARPIKGLPNAVPPTIVRKDSL